MPSKHVVEAREQEKGKGDARRRRNDRAAKNGTSRTVSCFVLQNTERAVRGATL